MKKTASIILAVLMLLALSTSAFAAASSVTAPLSDPEITTDLPEIVETDLEVRTIEELTEEEQEVFVEAVAALSEAVPEGMAVQYFNFVESSTYPASFTIILDNVENVSVMQFIDGEWVEVEVVKNPDGTYTITVDDPGFVAILTK